MTSSTQDERLPQAEPENPGEQISLRPMSSLDLTSCKQLSSKTGWSHRQEDWAQAFRTSTGAVLSDSTTSDIVGSAFVCLQGSWATIGLVIVRADYQGRGLGARLMKWALESAGERQVVLYSTEAGMSLYGSLGFEAVGGIVQYQGVVREQKNWTNEIHPAVRPARDGDMPDMVGLSEAATGFNREVVLSDICATARKVLVIENKDLFEDAGRIQAFGISRPFGRGYVVGPLVATTREHARSILTSLLADSQGEFVRLDCPKNTGLEDQLDAAGFKNVGTAVKMIRGTGDTNVSPVKGQQFALASQALS